jgi:phosphate transport system substrate-binding protein
VELIYALENKIPFGQMQNRTGKFVSASIETVSAAAADLKGVPADMRLSITNADGDKAYPISAWTYILLYQDQKAAEKGKALVDFLTWVTHDGQALASQLHYAPLPKSLQSKIDGALASVKVAQ